MDLVGILTSTKKGHRYICVIILFHKLEKGQCKSKCTAEVIKCILDLFYKFCVLKRLLTNQGREFVSEVRTPHAICVINHMGSICIFPLFLQLRYNVWETGNKKKYPLTLPPLNGTIQRYCKCLFVSSLTLCNLKVTMLCVWPYRTLTKLLSDKPNPWDGHLQATLFALRTKKQLTTPPFPSCLAVTYWGSWRVCGM